MLIDKLALATQLRRGVRGGRSPGYPYSRHSLAPCNISAFGSEDVSQSALYDP
jgi:hypothetical protein